MLLIKQSDTLQIHNYEHKSKELEPLKMFIPYEEGVAEKLKKVVSKYGFTTIFTKTKDLRGQIRTKQEDKTDNCLKKYTGETGRKLKKRMKEHSDDGEKLRNLVIPLCGMIELFIEKITGKEKVQRSS